MYQQVLIGPELPEKSALSSPNRNSLFFTSSQTAILDNFYAKYGACGSTSIEFVNKYSSDVFCVPVTCDNRACANPVCQDHRKYKFQKQHGGQEHALQKSMTKPKGWVFTGWRYPVEYFTRDFCRAMFLKLFHLLNVQSLTEFSIHMELKLYGDGTAYLHFHVVCGGLRDFRYTQKRWGRYIKYETAIKPENLGEYVSKYASKTPKFFSEYQRSCYHLLVYKLYMHRFSAKAEMLQVESDFLNVDLLFLECQRACYSDSYLNPDTKKGYLMAILEHTDHPPDFRGKPWLYSSSSS